MLQLSPEGTLCYQLSLEAKKLVLVLATSTPVTETREEAVTEAVEIAKTVESTKFGKDGAESKGEYPNLARVPCIWYPITFQKKSVSILALLDSGNEVNAIYLALAQKLELPVRPTDVGTQKIDGTMLDNFGIVVKAFSVTGKASQVKFFEETFLVANVSLEIVLGMPFLTLSDADIDFLGRKLWWKIYTNKEALLTTKYVELVGKKKFVVAALDLESETFVVYIVSLGFDASPSSSPLDVYPFRRPQISGLIAEKAFIKVSAKYSDFADVFSPDLASKFPKHTGINDHAIELVEGQQPPYGPIYSLRSVELETLKAYIETNLANGFIRPSKSPAGAPILFDRKSDDSLRLYINYQGLNNLTIKNRYPLPLIGESLDRLRRAKQFT